MDFSNSVILPREDFVELQEAAWSMPPKSTKDRIAGTAQATAWFAGAALCVTGAAWGWAKATDWLEQRRIERGMTPKESRVGSPLY